MNYATAIKRLLDESVSQDASDLHIAVGRKPTLRIYGTLTPLGDDEVITPQVAEGLITELMSASQRERFLHDRQLDFAFTHSDGTRFRINAYFQQGHWTASMRVVPAKIKSLEDLHLPASLHEFANLTQGFILMVGPAGHGKSTTTAAILDEITRSRTSHIVTIEDPIEYLFNPGNGIVSQREVGTDTLSFADGLKTVLRQDPDVIMVGEMRDAESISAAMTAAETGHLVFSTLHTNSASQTIDRIIDSFPAAQQQQVIAQVATTLVGIVSERLIPGINGGRVPALEIMVTNPAIRNLIRERKIFNIDSVIQTGAKEGMVTLDNSLAKLVKDELVRPEDAELYSLNPAEFRKLL